MSKLRNDKTLSKVRQALLTIIQAQPGITVNEIATLRGVARGKMHNYVMGLYLEGHLDREWIRPNREYRYFIYTQERK